MKPIDMLGMGPTREVTKLPGGNFKITVIPPKWAKAGNGKSIVLSPAQYLKYLRWMNGRILIQDAFPELNDDEREIILNGT